jgi:hypothetical protein
MAAAALEQALRTTSEDVDAIAAVLGTPQIAVRVAAPVASATSSFMKRASQAAVSASHRSVALLDWAVTQCEK